MCGDRNITRQEALLQHGITATGDLGITRLLFRPLTVVGLLFAEPGSAADLSSGKITVALGDDRCFGARRLGHGAHAALLGIGDGILWAQRYYTAGAGGTVIAVRSKATGTTELSYLTGDNHGTTTGAVDSGADQKFGKRSLSPFGQARAEAAVGDWVDDKGFLGKTADADTGVILASVPASMTRAPAVSCPSTRCSQPMRRKR